MVWHTVEAFDALASTLELAAKVHTNVANHMAVVADQNAFISVVVTFTAFGVWFVLAIVDTV
jgi:hypothetical protein